MNNNFRIFLDDHNVPTCKEIIRFAKDTRSWVHSKKNLLNYFLSNFFKKKQMMADPNNVKKIF